MKAEQARVLEALRRSSDWIGGHPDVIAQSGSSAQLSAQATALKTLIDRIEADAKEQDTQKQRTTLDANDEATLRKQLRDPHLKSIVKVAEAQRRAVPGIGVIKMPSSKLSSQNMITAAAALHDEAAKFHDVFIANGLPADFLDQLTAATTALKNAFDARGAARSALNGVGQQLLAELKTGRDIVKTIDAAFAHVLKSNKPVLASWRQAKRVMAKGGTARVTVASIIGSLGSVPSVPSVPAAPAPSTGLAPGGSASPPVSVTAVPAPPAPEVPPTKAA